MDCLHCQGYPPARLGSLSFRNESWLG